MLDFGVWAKVERSALRALAASVGATCELVYLEVDEEEQWRRVQARALTDAATTFEMTKADLELWRPTFEPPDAPNSPQRTSTPHRPTSIPGKPGWLSGGQRPSPATDPHNRFSTDLRPMAALRARIWLSSGVSGFFCTRPLLASPLVVWGLLQSHDLALGPDRLVALVDSILDDAPSAAG